MSAYSLFIIVLLVIFVLIFMSFRSVSIFRRAIEISPLYNKKLELQGTIKNLEVQIETAHQTISELEAKRKSMEADVAQAKLTIDDGKKWEHWLDNHDSELRGKKQAIETLNNTISDLTDQLNTANDNYRRTVEQHADHIKHLNDDIHQKELTLVEIEQHIAKLKAEKGGTLEEIERAKREAEEAKRVLATLEKKRETLDEKVRELEERKSALTGEVSDLEKKQQERNKLVGEIATLTGQLDPLHRDAAVIEEKEKFCWQDLDTPIPNIIHDRGLHGDELDWLENFRENLESSNIIFPERTLLAFHTGMKVQDYSPMTVLAGISGTGKSLLPELYAHAIGMNFLQVAVQPRWDSPQDMLGFYNYMEYRFKATELSRLLWGADPYNNKENAHTSMNLVLLDEMNLARVEYYFSDMLSKLEVRRGLNPANPSERQAAEIELECSAGLPRRRLFIGANTLFVGTMNEDESTQSLSDKVLDRANVIRFGKPAELNVKPDKQKFMAACSTEEMMTLEQWNNWRSSGNDKVAKDLEGPLQEINNKLMDLRRPFGHRVWQSIQAYVENYPGGAEVGGESFKHALADQIEMKILPKLNGVDKQDSTASEVLTSIQSIIAKETEDDELVNAVKSTIEDPSNAFFQWKGVSR